MKLLNNAIRTRIDQIIDRNRTQRLELYYQRQPQQTKRQPECYNVHACKNTLIQQNESTATASSITSDSSENNVQVKSQQPQQITLHQQTPKQQHIHHQQLNNYPQYPHNTWL